MHVAPCFYANRALYIHAWSLRGLARTDHEDDVLGSITGLDLGELGARVGALGPVDGGVAAVGHGEVGALEGSAIHGGKIVPERLESVVFFSINVEVKLDVPDLVAIEVVGEDLLGGASEDAVIFGGDLDGDTTSLLVEVKLLAPGLA